jgi:hypothetical protein
VLYVYDSFLLDVDENEMDVIEQIKQVFKDKKLQIKTKTVKNYNDIK